MLKSKIVHACLFLLILVKSVLSCNYLYIIDSKGKFSSKIMIKPNTSEILCFKKIQNDADSVNNSYLRIDFLPNTCLSYSNDIFQQSYDKWYVIVSKLCKKIGNQADQYEIEPFIAEIKAKVKIGGINLDYWVVYLYFPLLLGVLTVSIIVFCWDQFRQIKDLAIQKEE